jgi:hypothetical protein
MLNKSLIFRLSLFGLAMGILTINVIPSSVEPFCWLIVFIISAYLIAKKTAGRYFLHGFLTSLGNCVWVTGLHILFFNTYVANHQAELAQMSNGPLAEHPRLMMLIAGPAIGIISGLVLGLFSFLASKMAKRKEAA